MRNNFVNMQNIVDTRRLSKRSKSSKSLLVVSFLLVATILALALASTASAAEKGIG